MYIWLLIGEDTGQHSQRKRYREQLGQRSLAMTRKLKNIDALAAAEAQKLLPEIGLDLVDDEAEI